MAFLGQNHGLTPFEKCQFFDFFNFFFLLRKRSLFILEYRKRHYFWPILQKKKKSEKWQFLDQNHGLTPLKKCQFFDFLNFFFL